MATQEDLAGSGPMFSRIEHILRETPFFEDFSEQELDIFSKQLSLRRFPAKTTLFKQGDIGNSLFFIVDGEVEVRLDSADYKQVIIAALEQGSCVGEMSIVDDFPRSATIVTTTPAELLILSRSRFTTICKENPQVGLKFLSGIAQSLSLRLRKTSGRFADLA